MIQNLTITMIINPNNPRSQKRKKLLKIKIKRRSDSFWHYVNLDIFQPPPKPVFIK